MGFYDTGFLSGIARVTDARSRSISAENPNGEVGGGEPLLELEGGLGHLQGALEIGRRRLALHPAAHLAREVLQLRRGDLLRDQHFWVGH